MMVVSFVVAAMVAGACDTAQASAHRRHAHSAAARHLTARFAARHRRPNLSAGVGAMEPASGKAEAGGAYLQTGRASFYGGGRTAGGGHVGHATCAHRTLPFGTHVLVTNLANARQVVLIVNDRGPFVRGRIIDVSVGAAGTLGMLHAGTAPVSVRVVGPG